MSQTKQNLFIASSPNRTNGENMDITQSLADARTIIIYGPQGCGKSRHANALAKHYGKTQIVDAFTAGQIIPTDALVLTSDPSLQNIAIPFEAAMAAAFIESVELTVPLRHKDLELHLHRKGRQVHASVYKKHIKGRVAEPGVAFAIAEIEDTRVSFSDASGTCVWLARAAFDISEPSARLIVSKLGVNSEDDRTEGV